jgi:hypothetical protein
MASQTKVTSPLEQSTAQGEWIQKNCKHWLRYRWAYKRPGSSQQELIIGYTNSTIVAKFFMEAAAEGDVRDQHGRPNYDIRHRTDPFFVQILERNSKTLVFVADQMAYPEEAKVSSVFFDMQYTGGFVTTKEGVGFTKNRKSLSRSM